MIDTMRWVFVPGLSEPTFEPHESDALIVRWSIGRAPCLDAIVMSLPIDELFDHIVMCDLRYVRYPRWHKVWQIYCAEADVARMMSALWMAERAMRLFMFMR